MAAPAGSKPSRWGSFLTGLESKLDTILADEETLKQQNTSKSGTQTPARAPSISKGQDRLGEKLARAKAQRAQGKTGDLSADSSAVPTRTASPANGITSPRASLDQTRQENRESPISTPNDSRNVAEDSNTLTTALSIKDLPKPITFSTDHLVEDSSSARPSIESRRSISTRPSSDSARPLPSEAPKLEIANDEPAIETKPAEEYEKTLEQMRVDHEAAELRRQEETHEYLEKIDALQSKLQYLSKEAAEVAKAKISTSEPNSLERKLAQRDEQIALLMEEGHKLSQTELKHMSIIKKLRAKGGEDEKRLAETRRLAEKNEKSARESLKRAKQVEATERQLSDKIGALSKLEKELETTKADRNSKVSVIEDLQAQLDQAANTARTAEIEKLFEALEQEKQHTVNLTEELSRTRAERDREQTQLRTDLKDTKEKLEREKERARTLDIERQAERNALESRLEAFRARAEEATAGDSQVKLLRQLETLQNQSAVASENWQGIESSLLGRIASLEKERDEALKKEAEARRKVRENNAKSRRTEEELEAITAKFQDLSSELSSQSAILESLRDKLSKAETEISTLKSELASSSTKISTLEAQRIEDDKSHQCELESSRCSPDGLYQHFRNDSPALSAHKRRDSLVKKHTPRNSKRYQGLDVMSPNLERPVSRRSSTQPASSFADFRPPSRQDSASMLPHFVVNGQIPETSPIVESQADDGFFSGGHSPNSPEHTVADRISASTAAAGPSVQLVERMSAAVRRLESEKAASKDETARLATQRDEARDQIVNLMREVEDGKRTQDHLKTLETEKKDLERRLDASLELLGEKSEKVEELRNDVQDLKIMYRELVESKVGK